MSTATLYLGKSPLSNGLKSLYISLGVFVASAIIITILGHEHHSGIGLLVALVMLASMIMGFGSLIMVIVGLANASYYKAAKKAIESNAINPTYFIASDAFAGVVLVDEDNKKIMVNKCDVRDFSDVKEIGVKSTTDGQNNTVKTLTIIFKSGANPIETVKIKGGEAGDSQYHRLSNSLGFDSR
jgi:hypothetical protein